MAGEWIAYDLALPSKPEVQELIDETGQPVEVVVYRVLQLWGWSSMHCADGTARMTLQRLVRTCGGDEAFWAAVAAVGWLEIDEAGGTVAVPGWDRRFSQAAKSRAQQSDRSRAYEDRNPGRKQRSVPPDGRASDVPTGDRRRGEENRIPPPPPREALPSEAWEALRSAWNAGACPAARRAIWRPAAPPEHVTAVIVRAGWLDEALAAIPLLAACKYFDSPVTLHQFTSDGFVAKVLGGQYDTAKQVAKPSGHPNDRPSASDAAAAWQRAADDPEAVRLRHEYLAAKKRKAAAAAGGAA